MRTNERTPSFFSSLLPKLTPFVIALVLTGALVLPGCDTTEVTEPEIVDVLILPDTASLAVGGDVDFEVAALTAAGDTLRDHNLTINWKSTDPSVFTVANGGVATGQEAGTAFCVVEATDEGASKAAGRLVPIGLDSAFVSVF